LGLIEHNPLGKEGAIQNQRLKLPSLPAHIHPTLLLELGKEALQLPQLLTETIQPEPIRGDLNDNRLDGPVDHLPEQLRLLPMPEIRQRRHAQPVASG